MSSSIKAPGDQGNHFDTQALGQVRLAIVDLTDDGNQPFVDTESGICAVVNGELYGHKAYRAQLADEYKFRGNSDCEIVIALYRHYGRAFLSHLRGEFAFVLWDAKRRLLFAARDRFGIKPLYYTLIEGGRKLIVASEMKAFLAFGWKPEWDVDSLRGHAWKFGEQTFFKGVKKVSFFPFVLLSRSKPRFSSLSDLVLRERFCPAIT